MKREFTQRETVLMLILVVILLITGYVKLFAQPVQAQLTAAQTRLADAQDAQLIEQAKNTQLQKMEAELEELKKNGSAPTAMIPPYDNIDQVMVQLGAILKAAEDYQLTFSDVTFNSDLVMRPIQMSYTTKTYAQAKEIMTQLYGCVYRCSIGNISVSMGEGTVSVALTATFYEQYDDAAAADDPANAPDAQANAATSSSTQG
ncbi:MAG: hypothetical protein LKJ86_09040 [Oscillibacter sp.]|jgi:uncharacterized protein (UPF0333 family)|nr:hypothetical protein [Oscillibacter sp.]